jgi:hypothetical protein
MFRKTALFAFIVLFTTNLFCQDVISSQGDSYTDSSASIDFTIGEVVSFTGSSIENNITQGFHQTNWSFVSVVNHVPRYEATIYQFIHLTIFYNGWFTA